MYYFVSRLNCMISKGEGSVHYSIAWWAPPYVLSCYLVVAFWGHHETGYDFGKNVVETNPWINVGTSCRSLDVKNMLRRPCVLSTSDSHHYQKVPFRSGDYYTRVTIVACPVTLSWRATLDVIYVWEVWNHMDVQCAHDCPKGAGFIQLATIYRTVHTGHLVNSSGSWDFASLHIRKHYSIHSQQYTSWHRLNSPRGSALGQDADERISDLRGARLMVAGWAGRTSCHAAMRRLAYVGWKGTGPNQPLKHIPGLPVWKCLFEVCTSYQAHVNQWRIFRKILTTGIIFIYTRYKLPVHNSK